MDRCDGLEKLRKQQEEKRLVVHAAAIKQLLDTPDGSAWDYIHQHFGKLYTVKAMGVKASPIINVQLFDIT